MQYPVSLSTLILPRTSPMRRMATRDPVLRHGDFDAKFDDRTLICDLFETAEPGVLTAICPPFLNLWDDLDLKITATPTGGDTGLPCPFSRAQRVNSDVLTIRVPAGTTAITVHTAVGDFAMTAQPDLTARFAGSRTVFTLSQNNDLVWIRDWAAYYAREHGADTAIVYDNKSTRYDPDAVAEALAGVPELTGFAVIDWPFSYGPNDHRRDTTLWMCEADYCQRNMFEHVAARLLPLADGAVNVDIDEFIYSDDGRSVFDALDAAPSGYVSVMGTWIDAVHDGAHPTNRHAAYSRRRAGRFPEMCEEKWAVAPRKLPDGVQWVTHSIMGATAAAQSSAFTFAHFRGINTNWDLHMPASGTTLRTHADDTADYTEVGALRAALDRAFPDRAAQMIDTAPMPEADGRLLADIAQQIAEIGGDSAAREASSQYWYHQAVILRARSGAHDAATQAAARAVALAPGVFEYLDYLVTCLVAAEDLEAARSACTAALGQGDAATDARVHALSAVVAFRSKDYEAAIVALDQAQRARSTLVCDWVLRAAIEEKRGNPAAAERACQMARFVGEAPARLPALLADVARESLVTGFIANMNTLSNERMELDNALRTHAYFLRRTGQKDAELRIWFDLHRKAPLAIDVYRSIAMALAEQGATDQARAYAQRGVRMARDLFDRGPYSKYNEVEFGYWFAHTALRLAEMQISAGDYDDTLRLVDEVLALELEFAPLNQITNMGFGLLIEGANDHVAALAQRLLARPMEDNRPYKLAVEANLRRGITNATAARQVKRLAAAEPGMAANILSRYARLHDEAGRHKPAAHFYLLASHHEVDGARHALRALHMYDALEDFTTMAAKGAELCALHPDESMVHFLTAKALSRLGRLAEARTTLQPCLDLDPQFANARTMADRLDMQLAKTKKRA